jgi:hypothetical protein
MLVTTASHLIALKAIPHAEERVNCPVPAAEFEELLGQAAELLNISGNEFNVSICHREIKKTLKDAFPDHEIKMSPLLSSEERITLNL